MLDKADIAIIVWLQNNLGGEQAWHFWKFFTDLGDATGTLLVLLTITWLVGVRWGLGIALSVVSGAVAMIYLKGWFAQPRPFYVWAEVEPWLAADGFGMPSGHAAIAFGMLVAVRQLGLRGPGWRGWAWWVWLLVATLVAISRVVFGVHSPSQVVCGATLGAATAWLVTWLMNGGSAEVVRLCTRRTGVAALVVMALLAGVLVLDRDLTATAEQFDPPEQWLQRLATAEVHQAEMRGESPGDTVTAHRDYEFHRPFRIGGLALLAGVLAAGLSCAALVVRSVLSAYQVGWSARLLTVAVGLAVLAGLLVLNANVDAGWPSGLVGFVAPLWVFVGAPWVGGRLAKVLRRG